MWELKGVYSYELWRLSVWANIAFYDVSLITDDIESDIYQFSVFKKLIFSDISLDVPQE